MIDPDAHYRPIPADDGIEAPIEAVGNIGTDHLLVETVTTLAVEAWKNDGTDHQLAAILELEGRYNRTELPGYAKAILPLDSARMVASTLVHTLGSLEERRLAVVDVAAIERLVAQALGLKAEAAARYCHEWWLVLADLALAAGLEPTITALGWGILTPHGKGLTVKAAAQRRSPLPPAPQLVAAMVASATTQAIDNDASGIVAVGRRLARRYNDPTIAAQLAEHITHPIDPACPTCAGTGDVWPAGWGIAWADRRRYRAYGCPDCGPPHRAAGAHLELMVPPA